MGTGKDVPPWLQPVPEDESNVSPVTSNKMLFLTIGGAVVVISLFVAVILYLYDGTSNQPPIRVAAPTEDLKEKPQDPGGMKVDHQDKAIFEQSDGMKPRNQVSLGGQPEKPVESIPDDPVGDVIEATEQAQETVPEPAPEPAAEKPLEPAQSKAEAAEPQASTVSAPETTNTAATAQPKQAAAATPAAAGAYRVQLGAYGSEQSASRAWRAIRAKFPRDLRNVLPAYEPVQSGDRTLYRLRVGPYINRASADQVCLALRANEQVCIVVNP